MVYSPAFNVSMFIWLLPGNNGAAGVWGVMALYVVLCMLDFWPALPRWPVGGQEGAGDVE